MFVRLMAGLVGLVVVGIAATVGAAPVTLVGWDPQVVQFELIPQVGGSHANCISMDKGFPFRRRTNHCVEIKVNMDEWN